MNEKTPAGTVTKEINNNSISNNNKPVSKEELQLCRLVNSALECNDGELKP